MIASAYEFYDDPPTATRAIADGKETIVEDTRASYDAMFGDDVVRKRAATLTTAGIFGMTEVGASETIRRRVGRDVFAKKIVEIKRRVYAVTSSQISRIRSLPQHLVSGEANPEWLAARSGRVTGSTIAAVMGLNPYESPMDLVRNLLWRSFKGNAATAYGNQNEDHVQDSLVHLLQDRMVGHFFKGKRVRSFTVDNPGLVISKNDPFMAMSPDGVLTVQFFDGTATRVLLEYKAPYSKRRYKFKDEFVVVDADGASAAGSVDDIYKSQVTPGYDAVQRPIPKYYTPQLCYGMHVLDMDDAFFVAWVPVRSADGVVKMSKNIYKTPSGTIQFVHIRRKRLFEERMLQSIVHFWHTIYVPRLALKEIGLLKDGEVEYY